MPAFAGMTGFLKAADPVPEVFLVLFLQKKNCLLS